MAEPDESPTTIGPLAAILITPVLQVLRLANETLERRMTDVQAHLVEVAMLHQQHMLDKFHETDHRYQQRFEAQREAMNTAFAAQQVAMQTALTSAEKAVSAALAAADRAVTKAEIASEKRFESVNEFRAVLTEQSKTLTTRTEVDTAMKALTDRMDSAVKAFADKIEQQSLLFHTTSAALDKRLTLREGHQEGIGSTWAVIAGVAALCLTLLGIAVAIILSVWNRPA